MVNVALQILTHTLNDTLQVSPYSLSVKLIAISNACHIHPEEYVAFEVASVVQASEYEVRMTWPFYCILGL